MAEGHAHQHLSPLSDVCERGTIACRGRDLADARGDAANM
jgi:hypothetical protein